MRTRLTSAVLITLTAAALLTGCSVSAHVGIGNGSANSSTPSDDSTDAATDDGAVTVTSTAISTLAEDALEKSVGSRPAIDCGDDDVEVVNGNVVECVLTDPSSGGTYDTEVTISGVEGTKYSVDVQVAQTANE